MARRRAPHPFARCIPESRLSTAVPADRCPSCGRDNHCGAVRGARECWCFHATIAPAALAAIPPPAKDRACLCPDCAAGQVPSPCIRVCALDGRGTCTGCGRTGDEIERWPASTDDQRREIVARAARRRSDREDCRKRDPS